MNNCRDQNFGKKKDMTLGEFTCEDNTSKVASGFCHFGSALRHNPLSPWRASIPFSSLRSVLLAGELQEESLDVMVDDCESLSRSAHYATFA